MIRLLFEVARGSFRRASSYRVATASGVFVNTVFGVLRASVLVYLAAENGGSVRGMTGSELATFAFVSQGFIMLVGMFGDPELANRIRTGDVVIDLYRPVDLQWWWLSSWLGSAAFQLVGRGLPPVLLGALLFDLTWPDPWWHWLVFAVSVVLASVIGFAVRFCASLVTFWLMDSRGIDQMVTLVMNFFAGLLLPLNLFPSWLETVARALPFASMIQLPAEIFLGQRDGIELVGVIAQQLFWMVAMLGIGRWMLSRATYRVVIQGG
ncbi:MAG: ABC-2 family transporter protein [Acidimicrobiales bacterium]